MGDGMGGHYGFDRIFLNYDSVEHRHYGPAST